MYDPEGMLLPITNSFKKFFQQLVTDKASWDTPLTEERMVTWRTLTEEMKLLNNLKIPRAMDKGEPSKYTLQCFCDASKDAYSAVVYLRAEQADGTSKLSFVSARHRLAPINKPMSIPRLELEAIKLGTVLLQFVKTELEVQIDDEHGFLFSDSMVAHSWVNSDKKLPTYVQNRVHFIRQYGNKLRHVEGGLNSANYATRRLSVADIANMQHSWWKGPEFLTEPEEKWPVNELAIIDTEELISLAKPEKRQQVIEMQAKAVIETKNEDSVFEMQRFSSLRKLLNVTVYVMRFIKKAASKLKRYENEEQIANARMKGIFKKTEKSGAKTCQEIALAQRVSDFLHQRECFNNVFHHMEQKKKNELVKSLNLFQDDFGLLRSMGRFVNAELPEAAKYSVLQI